MWTFLITSVNWNAKLYTILISTGYKPCNSTLKNLCTYYRSNLGAMTLLKLASFFTFNSAVFYS